MLAVPHVLIGAAIGAIVTDSPYDNLIAFGGGWLTHYPLDALPHWERIFGYQPGDEFNPKTDLRSWPKTIYIQAIIDVVIALAALIMIIYFLGYESPFWESSVFWGGIGGIFPDLVDNVPYWNRFTSQWPIFKSLNTLHQSTHISTTDQRNSPKYMGLLTQVIAIIIALWILL